MRTLLLLVPLLSFIACGNPTQESKTENTESKTENTETPTEVVETSNTEEVNTTEEEEYSNTSEEVNTNLSVMDFYNAHLKALEEEAKTDPRSKTTLKILKKNIANGYLKYAYDPPRGYMAGVREQTEEMAYFTSKNGKNFAAVASTYKMEGQGAGNSELPKFYELENNRLVDKTNVYFPTELKSKVEKALAEDKARSSEETFVYVKIPESGTTIEIGLAFEIRAGYGQAVSCKLEYNVANGTFEFVAR